MTVPAPQPPPHTKQGANWSPVGTTNDNCGGCAWFGSGGGYPSLGGQFDTVSRCHNLTDVNGDPEYTPAGAICDFFLARS